MNEIEKMYRTAKVVPSHHYCNDCQYDMSAECPIRCPDNVAVYPLFTAEKQLELENFLLEDSENKTFTQFEILKTIEDKFLYVYRFQKDSSGLKRLDVIGRTRQECLAKLINNLWQSLTEEEKQQVKGILK